jgi:DNA-binding NtrC family response regulator
MKKKPLAYYLDLMKSANEKQDWVKIKHYGEIALKKLSSFSYTPYEKHLLYVRLGTSYKYLGLYTNSLEAFYKAYLTVSKHQLGESYLAYCAYNIGINLLSLDNISQALSQFQKVERYFQKYGDKTFPMEERELYSNSIMLGFCYLGKEDLNKVREVLEEKLPLHLVLPSKNYAFRNYYYLKGEYLMAQKEYKQARQSFEEYIKVNEIHKPINYEDAIIKGNIYFAIMDLLEGQMESAINILESLFTRSYHLKFTSCICEIGILLSKCYLLKDIPDKSVLVEGKFKPFLKKLDIMWFYKKTSSFEKLYHQLQTIYQSHSPYNFSARSLLIDTVQCHYRISDKKHAIIGRSAVMIEALHLIEKIASTDLPVLIQGETGTGKELIARAIYNHSMRKGKIWLATNCGSLSETLLENELFGHVKGAFTDAKEDKKGYIELASEGTLFLDEVSEMSSAMQQKLLRVMDEKLVWRLGAEKPIPVNTRFVFASNKNIEELVTRKKFREDLFYRINTIVITLPPLRDRKDDIALLVTHFLNKYSSDKTLNAERLTPNALAFLQAYPWPGNVRELENEIKRICTLYPHTETIDEEMISETIKNHKSSQIFLGSSVYPEPSYSFKELTDEFQRKMIVDALNKAKGNMLQTAKLLKCDRANLYKKIKQLGIKITDNYG